ncbi:MAG TPA: sigma 54-interacting transcriptional regulator [Gemmatimonadaceae bacterium]|nr:sigma 54-interacting transcriptional regulator [Gemmatimonadaceae bacterium]
MSTFAPELSAPSSAQAARNPSFEMLRRVTRGIATTQALPQLLNSVVTAIVEHTGAVISRVFLYRSDEECEVCRTMGPVFPQKSGGERCLHLSASAGEIPLINGPDHLVPMRLPVSIVRVALDRTPILSNDVFNDPNNAVMTPQQREIFERLGIVAVGAFPLDFRGELLGVMGMLSRRPFSPEAFELLEVFTHQVAMAIKSAHLFAELERYKDRLQVENAYLQDEIRVERGFEEIVGESPALRAVLRKVKQVASVETTVLLTGETGTGKELIARAIHGMSPRKDRAMIKVNCGAIPQGVVESELFGHEKGAFTGALQRRIGRFELADKGTLFMDEVGELPLDTQVKMLRVLQEQEFERVGSARPMKVDVRLVAATNRDLEKEVAGGRFRSDLFYRLNVFPIRVPPLRERSSDIPLLVQHCLAQLQRKLAKPLKGVAPESLDQLQRYSWPGNVRELQNVMERACVLARGPVVEIGDMLNLAASQASGQMGDAPIATLDENERSHIRRALAAANGRIHGAQGAAAMLGINPSTLRSRMQKLNISKQLS